MSLLEVLDLTPYHDFKTRMIFFMLITCPYIWEFFALLSWPDNS